MSSTLSDSEMEEGSTTSKRSKFGHKFFSKFSKKNKENNNHGTKKKNYQSEIEKQQERARDLVASHSSTNSNHLAYSSNGSIGEYAEARSRQEMMDLAAANKGRESSYNLIALAYANSRPQAAMTKDDINSTNSNTNTVTAATVDPATTTTDVAAVTSSSTHSLLENMTSAYTNFFSRPTTIQKDETNNTNTATNTNTTMVTASPAVAAATTTATTTNVLATTTSNNNNTHPFDETIENKKKEEKKTKSASWFSGTKMFTNMCNDVFDSIDEDNSNEINEKELYTGLLLLHLQLGLYAGPAACKPLSKKNAYDLFHKLDTNQDGTLDRTEFQNVIALLMGNVITRIALQFVCTLVIVPFVATTFLFKMNDLTQFMTGTVIPLFHDEQYQSLFYEKYLPLFQMIIGWDILTKYVAENEYSQLMVDKYHGIINDVLNSNNNTVVVVTQTVTNSFQVMMDKYHELMHQIPEETWSSLPLTVVSTIVTMMILPYTIMKTDNFFQFVANKFPRKKKK